MGEGMGRMDEAGAARTRRGGAWARAGARLVQQTPARALQAPGVPGTSRGLPLACSASRRPPRSARAPCA
jgi:hypothetical protein